MEKEKTIRPEGKDESATPKETTTFGNYAEKFSEDILRVKKLIDNARAICEPRAIGDKEELTVRDIVTNKIIFYTDSPEQINYLLEGVLTIRQLQE